MAKKVFLCGLVVLFLLFSCDMDPEDGTDGGTDGNSDGQTIDNSDWTTLGTGSISAGEASYISIDILGDAIYAAFRDESQEGKLTVGMYDDTSSWQYLPYAGVSAGEVTGTSVKVDWVNKVPCVVYYDESDGGLMASKLFAGASPVDLYSSTLPREIVTDFELNVFEGVELRIGYFSGLANTEFAVAKYEFNDDALNVSWGSQDVTTIGSGFERASQCLFLVDAGDDNGYSAPYHVLAYPDPDSGNKLTVDSNIYPYGTGSTSSLTTNPDSAFGGITADRGVGSDGFSSGAVTETSVTALSHYLYCAAVEEGRGVVVYTYDVYNSNQVWTWTGGYGTISDDNVLNVEIRASRWGNLYLAMENADHSLDVLAYDDAGNTWTVLADGIGTVMAGDDSGDRYDFAFEVYGENLYLAYSDAANSGKLAVKVLEQDVEQTEESADPGLSLGYSGAVGSWVQGTEMNNGRYNGTRPRTFKRIYPYNGYLYVLLGGYHANDCEYAPINTDGTFGEWKMTSQANIHLVRDTGIAMTMGEGYAYAIGGPASPDSNPYETKYIQYAPILPSGGLGEFRLCDESLPANTSYAAATVYDGYLYITGGWEGAYGYEGYTTVYYAEIMEDGQIGALQSTTSLPEERERHGCFAHNGFLYVYKGESDNEVNYDNEHNFMVAPINDDGSVGSWSGEIPLPDTDKHGICVAYGEYLYYISPNGRDVDGDGVITVFSAPFGDDGAVSSGDWTQSDQSLIQGRYGFAGAAYNGMLYITNGRSGDDWTYDTFIGTLE